MLLADFGAWRWPHWVGVALALALAGLNAWLGVTTRQPPLLFVAGSFLLAVALFATRFWRPVLYLLGVVHLGVLFVLWLLAGLQFRRLGLLVGACSLALATLATYLFVAAEDGDRW
jgi:hypothetical protein